MLMRLKHYLYVLMLSVEQKNLKIDHLVADIEQELKQILW